MVMYEISVIFSNFSKFSNSIAKLSKAFISILMMCVCVCVCVCVCTCICAFVMYRKVQWSQAVQCIVA